MNSWPTKSYLNGSCHQQYFTRVADGLVRHHRGSVYDPKTVVLVELDGPLVLLEDKEAYLLASAPARLVFGYLEHLGS